MYKVIFSRQAAKDFDKLKRAGFVYAKKVKTLIEIVSMNPYQNPPPYEKLVGDLQGFLSRRINEQHRFVYEVLPNTQKTKDKDGTLYDVIVHILKIWTHYE